MRYELRVEDDVDRDAVDRVHGFHAEHCPVARSVRDAIDVTTSFELHTAS